MKVYISLPISKRPEKTMEEREKAAFAIAEQKKIELQSLGHEAVSPFDACPIGCGLTNAEILGMDIALLLSCDAIYKMTGWRKSDGCTLESIAANIYGIKEIGDDL